MSEYPIRLQSLFEKYLDNTCSRQELQEFWRLVAQLSEEDLITEDLRRLWLETRRLPHQASEVNWDKAYEKMMHKAESVNVNYEALTRRPRISRALKATAVAAAGIIVVAGVGLLVRRQHRILQAAPPPVAAQHLAKKHFIRLPDGSTVILNEGSTLAYSDSFFVAAREVTLSGEGYFDIRRQDNAPFVVHIGKINVTVLGTAFNIKSYPHQENITVTVTKGKVKVSDEKKTYAIVNSNQQLVLNINTDSSTLLTSNPENALAWEQKYFQLDDISLEDAAVLIGNKYHVNVVLANPALKKCRISATFLKQEDLNKVLTVVSVLVNAKFSMQPNDRIVIDGPGCK